MVGRRRAAVRGWTAAGGEGGVRWSTSLAAEGWPETGMVAEATELVDGSIWMRKQWSGGEGRRSEDGLRLEEKVASGGAPRWRRLPESRGRRRGRTAGARGDSSSPSLDLFRQDRRSLLAYSSPSRIVISHSAVAFRRNYVLLRGGLLRGSLE